MGKMTNSIFTLFRQSLLVQREKTHQTYDDQIDCYNVIENARVHKNQNPSDEGNDWGDMWIREAFH